MVHTRRSRLTMPSSAGETRAPTATQVWRARAPYGCKFFAWLVSKDRYWMADRLQRRGLPHPDACPLCDQEPESIQHLLGCVVVRQVWAWALNLWDRSAWILDADTELVPWWVSRPFPQVTLQRDLWTSIILVFWCIWRHRNDIVFNRAQPGVGTIQAKIREEYARWHLARLYRSGSFGFPEPVQRPLQLLVGE
jgi:hypothetical protein